MSSTGSHFPKINKVPFWIADAVLIGTAVALVAYGPRPLSALQMGLVVACAALGGWLAAMPFLREYHGAVQLAETDRLEETTAKLGQLEAVADRIAHATSEWQGIQDRARQTATTAQDVVDRLSREAETFATAVSRAADGDKQTLKLEVEKLRKGETEWLQSVGRLMDHVFALHIAALRSGQQGVIEQIERFHAACREALRRVGFVPIVATPDEPFDPRKHQAVDGSRPGEGAKVDETVALGFLYQGRLLRPIGVTIVGEGSAAADAAGQTAAEDSESGANHPTSDGPFPPAPASQPAAESGSEPLGAS